MFMAWPGPWTPYPITATVSSLRTSLAFSRGNSSDVITSSTTPPKSIFAINNSFLFSLPGKCHRACPGHLFNAHGLQKLEEGCNFSFVARHFQGVILRSHIHYLGVKDVRHSENLSAMLGLRPDLD